MSCQLPYIQVKLISLVCQSFCCCCSLSESPCERVRSVNVCLCKVKVNRAHSCSPDCSIFSVSTQVDLSYTCDQSGVFSCGTKCLLNTFIALKGQMLVYFIRFFVKRVLVKDYNASWMEEQQEQHKHYSLFVDLPSLYHVHCFFRNPAV